jgi:ubiquinone/menaquinone biosynthesis C-methylase UbiE
MMTTSAGAPPVLTSDRIQDALYAFTRSQILFSAIDLDLFSLVAEGNDTLEALRDRLLLSRRGLRMLLNGLVGIGFLQVTTDGAYALPPDVARFLVRDSAEYIGGMVHHCKRLYENWAQLTDAVRFGQPAGGAQSLAQLETYFAELVKGLYVSNYPPARKLARRLLEERPSALADAAASPEASPLEILDVAGGSAVWSIALLETFTNSRATVIDFPSVTHVAETYVAQHGLDGRYTYWPGDLEELDLPESHFDVAIMANICHALGPISTRKAFQKLLPALKPGGRLAIVDFVPDNRRSEPGWPLIFGVNMLVTTPEGDVFTAAEYTKWLTAAGFSRVGFHELETDVTAIIAER